MVTEASADLAAAKDPPHESIGEEDGPQLPVDEVEGVRRSVKSANFFGRPIVRFVR